jgi:hypothetical protein
MVVVIIRDNFLVIKLELIQGTLVYKSNVDFLIYALEHY